jgi:hypothetical protein
MRPVFALAVVVALALGCSTTKPPVEDSPVAEEAAVEERAAEPHTYRLGFWEIDLVALDTAPNRTTFRLLDFYIFKLLEIGSGEQYHSFSLVEMPVLLNVLTTRRDFETYEHRFADLQALAFAVGRATRESSRKSELHFLKLPIIGSLYGRDVDGEEEELTILYVIRREVNP